MSSLTQQIKLLRIVVASPNDVQAEREIVEQIATELNRSVAADRGLRLEVSRWETDAIPGFHPKGPQALIDPVLKIQDCDLVIAIFWKRFGTPTLDAESGTEHEFRVAFEAWQRVGRPQIMVYFNQKPFTAIDPSEAEQLGRVLAFKQNFPKEGLWWPYRGAREFERLARNHLTQFVRRHTPFAGPSQPSDLTSALGKSETSPESGAVLPAHKRSTEDKVNIIAGSIGAAGVLWLLAREVIHYALHGDIPISLAYLFWLAFLIMFLLRMVLVLRKGLLHRMVPLDPDVLLEQHYNSFIQAKRGIWSRWKQLLNPSLQISLLYSRMLGRLTFGRRRTYILISSIRLITSVTPLLLIIFFAASEAGCSLPGSFPTRDFLYLNHISIAGHIYTEREIRDRASQVRKELLKELMTRRKADWFTQRGLTVDTVREAWIQSQASSAVLMSPEGDKFEREIEHGLDLLFTPGIPIADANGRPYGWLVHQNETYTNAEPALWTTVALIRLYHRLDNQQQQVGLSRLAFAQQASSLYHPELPESEESGSWNMFPNQSDPWIHSTYTATLALLALLEAKKQELPWIDRERARRTGNERRDLLLLLTVRWLVDHFVTDGRSAGWAATSIPSSADPIQEGLTFQIFAELLRAEKEAGVGLPARIKQEIPRQLGKLLHRTYDFKTLTFKNWSGIKLRNHRGQLMDSRVGEFRYVWYPWSIYCVNEWLRAASTSHSVSWRDVALARRVRDHLIMDLSRNTITKFRDPTTHTFFGANVLFALSSDIPAE